MFLTHQDEVRSARSGIDTDSRYPHNRKVISRDSAILSELCAKNRRLLSAYVRPDDFLVSIGRTTPEHAHLRNCTQGVQWRQIAFLSAVLRQYFSVPPSSIKVLDWGCGKGHISYMLRTHNFDVVSCDVTNRACNDSAFELDTPIIKLKGITVVPLQHDCNLPFDDASFDCVISSGVLEHVPSDMCSMKEIRRILKPGGVFFVSFLPYYLSWTQALGHLLGNQYHDHLYTKAQLKDMAEKSNFVIANIAHGQFFPKNSVPISVDPVLEPLDRFVCRYTPLKYFATNLEAVLIAAGD